MLYECPFSCEATISSYHQGHSQDHWLWKDGASLQGCRDVGRKILAEEGSSFLVSDTYAKPSLAVKREQLCSQTHPGVCKTRDSEVFGTVLHICLNLNTLCRKFSRWELIGKVLKFEILRKDGEVISLLRAISLQRFARPAVQVHGFQ